MSRVIKLSRSVGAIVTLYIVSELTEDAHWQAPSFPPDFRRQIKYQEAVNAGLIATRIAVVMNVKRITIARVVIERRRQLEINAARKSKSRSYLPRQHECVRCRNFLACLITVVRTDHWIRPYRILRILIVINILCEVCEDVELQFVRFRGVGGYNTLTVLTIPSLAIRLNRLAASPTAQRRRP